jgi:leader peptidase (prepilin peptidase)/N-methyltransferase
VALALIDLEVKRLPDRIVLPAYPVAGALLVLAGANPGGAPDWPALVRAVAGAAILALAYALMWVAYPKGMGLGDVKLAGVLGLYLGAAGWGALAIGAFAAFLLGGLFSAALMIAGRAGRRSKIPFGPWMLAGAWVGLVVGEPLWAAYLGLA